MKITLDKEKIKYYSLPLGAVFEYGNTYYMKVNTIEFDEADGEDKEYTVSKALNLTTLMVEDLDDDLDISNNYISKPKEIIFK